MSFDRSAKNRHASKIGSRVAPCRNHEPCLTTLKYPGFRHHPHERPEFLSPLLLLFIDFSAAPKHCRNASTAFTGMRAGGGAGLSTRLCLVHALIIDWAPRLLPMQCPEFRLIVSLPSLNMVCPSRGSCSSVVGYSHSSPCPACCAGTGIAKSFRPGLFDRDIVRF